MKTIVELAHEAAFHVTGDRVMSPVIEGSDLLWLLERFADLVRADAIAKEREDIAKHYEANLFVEHMGGSIADYVISRGNQ